MGRKKQAREFNGQLFPVSLEEAKMEAYRALDVAIERYKPSKVFAMFSGGDDSLSSTIITSSHPRFTGCLHINTGIGIKETNQYVRDTCNEQKWPLIELHPTDKSYEEFVLEYGFPGPAAHRYCYVWLKERALNFFVSNVAKNSEHDRILLVTGARTTESKRRMGKARLIQRDACKVWVNPLFYWEKRHCLELIEASGIPRNPVVELIHMSGECLCLAPETLVSAETGWKPIKDFVEGERVWTLVGGGMQLAKVATVHRNAPRAMLQVKAFFLPPVEVTPEHRFWVRPYSFKGHALTKAVGEAAWVSADDLAVAWKANKNLSAGKQHRHYIGYPFRTEEKLLGLTEPQLKLLGYFMSEGAYQWRQDKYRSGIAGIVFTVSAQSQKMAEDMKRCVEEGLGLHVGWRKYTDKRTGRDFIMVRASAKAASEFVSRYSVGRYCTEKHFTEDVMMATLAEQKLILEAMWRGDGSHFTVTRNNYVEVVSAYATASTRMALQVQEMLLRQGEVYGLNKSSHDVWLVRRTTNMRLRNGFIEDGVLWTGLQRVEPCGFHETLNLTVEGEPNFRTAGGLVHNCGAFANNACSNELREIASFFPCVDSRIKQLEKQCRDVGVHAQWGVPPSDEPTFLEDSDMPLLSMCGSCEARSVGGEIIVARIPSDTQNG